MQKRIKDQQWPNADYPAAQKIDITIVVDMLLTGFDSKYLNTLYVDKNLKYHGLIQAFSRTNRVLNGTKPYGNILDFRQQQGAVERLDDDAVAFADGSRFLYALHFGHFAGVDLRILYFLLGLAVCAMIVVGNMLWLNKYSKKKTMR